MRSVIFALASLLAVGCGLPEVEAPGGGQAITSDKPESEADVPKPVFSPAPPQKYSGRTLVLRGTAVGAARIFVKGAGNPVAATVLPSETFCVAVDLASSPAEYVLQIQSQSTNGDMSEVVEVKVVRQPDAPPPPSDTMLCDGTPLN